MEKTAQDEVDRAGHGLGRGALVSAQNLGIEESVDGLDEDFDGERRIQVAANLTLALTPLEEGQEVVFQVPSSQVLESFELKGRKSFQTEQEGRLKGGETLAETGAHVAQLRRGRPRSGSARGMKHFGDGIRESFQNRAQERFLVGEMAVQGLLARAQVPSEIGHGDRMEPVGEEAGLGGVEDAMRIVAGVRSGRARGRPGRSRCSRKEGRAPVSSSRRGLGNGRGGHGRS